MSKSATKTAQTVQSVARQALELDQQIRGMTTTLDGYKETLRNLADGKLLTEVVEGLGTVVVSKPRGPSAKTIVVLDEAKLATMPDVRAALFKKGILVEQEKEYGGAAASVSFKHNV